MQSGKKILILGKLPPPYFGPAIATKIILSSELCESFELIHFDTKLNREITELVKFGIRKLFDIPVQYLRFIKIIFTRHPSLLLIPISQATSGFIKDSLFVLIGKTFRRKILIQLRGSNIKNWLKASGQMMNNYFSFTMKRADGVIVLGNNLRYIFEDYFPGDKIFVVPNGGNYLMPGKEAEQNKFNILYLSNPQQSKGFDDVIEAVNLISNNSGIKFELNVVGRFVYPEDEKKIITFLAETKLPVRILPPADGNSKLKYLANADVLVFPPREPEGHPWVIVEAMAAGLPVISTDQGAITESVLDGVNGFIVEPNSPKQIAEKLEVLIKNEELRKRMGKESRRLYEENFTEDKMVERLKNVFEKVISG